MIFQLPWLLAGLFAMSIPVIIHLFHRSRFKVVPWAAMHLLEAVVRTNQRRVQMEQWLLLALRMLAVGLLVLLWAGPVWQGARLLLKESRTATVVLLDDSYSMAGGRAGVKHFNTAREDAAKLLGELRPGSEGAIILMGEGGGALTPEPGRDMLRLGDLLQKTEPGAGVAKLAESLDLAGRALTAATEPVREVVVFTDFQRVSFPRTGDERLRDAVARLRSMPLPPSVVFWDVGSPLNENVAVESLEFTRLAVGVGQKFQVRANLRNYGNGKYNGMRVVLRTDGKDRAVQQTNLAEMGRSQVLFQVSFDAPGSHTIEVEADADLLTEDNRCLASIAVRDRISVLLVNGQPSVEPMKGETDFAEIALMPFGSGRVDQADLIAPRTIIPDALNGKLLAESDVVVLANVRRLTDEQIRALRDFVAQGKGVLLFPGSGTDVPWWNDRLASGKAPLAPLPFAAVMGDFKEGAMGVGIVAQRYDNLALEFFNDPRNGSLEGASIRGWLKMKETPELMPEGVTVLARLSTGDPFLVERTLGEGRVIACATALDADWGNLPTRPFYLPLLQRLCVYLSSTVYPPRNLRPGEALLGLFPQGAVGRKGRVEGPAGRGWDVAVTRMGDRGGVQFSETARPGLYTLTVAGEPPVKYVVNATREESDLQRLNPEETAALCKTLGVQLVRSREEYKNLEREKRFGIDLWKPFLLLVLLALFGELLLQQWFIRRRPKPRSGPAVGTAAHAVAQAMRG